MAGASITIDDQAVNQALRDLQLATGNLTPVFQDIGEYLLYSHRERFERQVSPDGQHWAELNPTYKAEKEYNQDKILVLDGILMGGLHYQVEPNQLQFGTNEVYGATHQFGREDANISARPFLGVSDSDDGEILAIIYRHLQDALPG